MRTEHGKIDGTTLNEEFVLYGMCTGSLIVERGGILHLYGMCTGPLYVKAGGVAYIHGTCANGVTNAGGMVEVFGTISGGLNSKDNGITKVDPKAVVN